MKAFSSLTFSNRRSALSEGKNLSATRLQKRPPIILAVDDNEDSLFLIQCALEGAGIQCQLMLSHGGVEALQLAAVHQPRLILLDISLPDISGIEVLRRLRSSQHSRKTPIVAISASLGPLDPFGIRDAGFTYCLAKPYLVSELEHIVSVYCC